MKEFFGKIKTFFTSKNGNKLKNEAFLKRSSILVVITACALAGLILLNAVVGLLADRFVLEFDMSEQKVNTISKENIDFIKTVKDDVTVIFCAEKSQYQEYMATYAQEYAVLEGGTDYYQQTVNLVEKYGAYNKKIDVQFIDTQSTEFAKVANEYSDYTVKYGDIIVSRGEGDNRRVKVVGFEDIYVLTQNETYAAYGQMVYDVTGNSIETALTSAIAFVTSDETKTIAIITGHSKEDYTDDYRELLKVNNFEVELIEDNIISSIPDKYDAVVIAAPTSDFLGSELEALQEYLENKGKLNKGLIYFADSNAPYLPNLSDFLNDWGIAVEQGILFETNANNHMPDQPTVIGIYPTENDDITAGIGTCISGYNVGLSVLFEEEENIKVTSILETPDTVINAPVGTSDTWQDASKYNKEQFSSVIQSSMMDYEDEKTLNSSYVFAVGSIEFIFSDYSNMATVSNQDIVLAITERAAGAENTGIKFTSKKISNDTFLDQITEGDANAVLWIFVIIIPVVSIVAGIVVYIRRRNS